MAKPEFQDRDLGYKDFFDKFKQNKKGRSVKVGILKRAGVHKGAGTTVAQVAAYHEFGTKHLPERSFMRSTMDEKDKDIKSLSKSLLIQTLFQSRTVTQALEILGATIQKFIKAKITSGLKPPLKPSTILKKGSSKPLIDTGQLLNSIDFEVEK